MKIVYKSPTYGVCVITPVMDAGLTLVEIAAKDVPTGMPYLIVEDTFIPTDYTFRMAWDIEENLLTDGVGA